MHIRLTFKQADLFVRTAHSVAAAHATQRGAQDVRVTFESDDQPALVHALFVSGYDMGFAPVTVRTLLTKLKNAHA